MMLTGSDAVGPAACQTHRTNSFSSDFKMLGLYTHISLHTHRLWSRTGPLSPVLSLPRTPKQRRGNPRNSCNDRKLKALVLLAVLLGFTDLAALRAALTPSRIHHSRTADPQQRSPVRSSDRCGYTACPISPQRPQRPVGNQRKGTQLSTCDLCADSIGAYLFCQSYPTGPTGALVSDLLDCGTVAPLLPRIEGVWEPHAFNVVNSKEEKDGHWALQITLFDFIT